MRRKHLITVTLIGFLLLFVIAIQVDSSIAFPKPFVVYRPDIPEDTLIETTAGTHYKKNIIHRAVFGTHYRELWATPVKAPMFDVGKIDGGLIIGKAGGSHQSMSLRLKNNEGREYVIRTIDKDQSKALPVSLQKTIIKKVIRDQASALNPYGALIIPPLAEAAGIMHTNPRLYYVPYDVRLKESTNAFAGKLVIFEEYPNDGWQQSSVFKHSEKIISTEALLETRYKGEQVKIDNRMYARCRLFDLLIGDWDRHGGQWRWVAIKNGEDIIYQPAPRDRDAAFYKYNDGILTSFSLLFNNKLQTFSKRYKSIPGLMKNSRYLDNLLLSGLNKEDWQSIADSMKLSITDNVIYAAVKLFPTEIYEEIGNETAEILIARRDKLNEAATKAFEVIAREITIVATDANDRIEIKRINDKETEVIITTSSSNGAFQLYKKNFSLDNTRKIAILALRGEDEITITGNVKNAIRITINGGEGNDKISDNSYVSGPGKRTSIIDTKEGNTIFWGKEARNKTSSDTTQIFHYNRTGNKKDN